LTEKQGLRGDLSKEAQRKAPNLRKSCQILWDKKKTASSFLFAGENLAAAPTTGRQIALISGQISYESPFCLQLRVFQY